MKWFPSKEHVAIELKLAANTPFSEQVCFNSSDLGDWYAPVLISPSTIGEYASNILCLEKVISVLRKLESDAYVRYLLAYYNQGTERFGSHWRYADITTVLFAASELARPKSYLEIGVRRGRSMAMVAAVCPQCRIVGFDMWQENYAGMPNPGPEFIRTEMSRLGYAGNLELVSGDSHKTLPDFFAQHPNDYFDLITVDGDHSNQGALCDLQDIAPRLAIGGIVVFDDISHPDHPGLKEIWRNTIVASPHFKSWEFTELGYGVGIGVRI